MIEGPDPRYFDEHEEIPSELLDLMSWELDGDGECLISGWLTRSVSDRLTILEHLQSFLARPPSEFQIYALQTYHSGYMTDTELLAWFQNICHRLELSLRESA